LRPITLIPFVGLQLSLYQNPHELVSAIIVRVRIYNRGLTHVVKLVRSIETKVQHLKPMSNKYIFE
jgi:hypothetical protein